MSENWKQLNGVIEHGDSYEVSTLGNIRNVETKHVLRPGKNKHGYLQVSLSKKGKTKTYQIHRLVALAFIPNPDNKLQVNHKKGKEKFNNRVDNLEWATPKENMSHAFATGLNHVNGESNGSSKLTTDKVILIKQLLASGANQKEVAKQFNVSRETVSSIQRGILWSHVEVDGFTPHNRAPEGTKGNSRISENDVRKIRQLFGTGEYSYKDIANMYGVTDKNISMIVRRVTWKNVD